MKRRGAPRVVLAVAGFILVGLLGFLAISGFRIGREGESVTVGGASGHSYAIRILRKLGYRVRVFYDLPDLDGGMLGANDALVGLCDDLGEDWDEVSRWTRKGGRLFLHPGTANAGEWSGTETVAADGGLSAPDRWSGGARFPVPYDGLAFSQAPASMEVVASVDGKPAFGRVPAVDGEIVLMADGSALTNAALKSGGEEYAVFLHRLFLPSRGGTVALYRERRWAKGETDPVRSLFTGPMLPVTLQLLGAFAVFAAGSAVRFGEPQRFDPRGRRSSAAHLDAVGAFYARGRSEDMADESNAEHFLALLRRRLSLSPQAGAEIVAAKAARASGLGAEAVLRLLVPGRGLKRGEAAIRSAERFRIIEKLVADRRTK